MSSKRLKHSEDELVLLLKSKNIDGFNELYQNYAAAIYGVIIRLVIKDEIAEEILQDVFMKIWNGIESYDTSKGRLYTWILNIARNASIDYTRSKQAKKSQKNNDIEALSANSNATLSISLNTDTIGIESQVMTLKEEYRILIDLIYFQGYTQQETADELDMPIGTVKTRVRAALIQLRQIVT
jgi:RNA polymerase sigma factor (sigma-70 family)